MVVLQPSLFSYLFLLALIWLCLHAKKAFTIQATPCMAQSPHMASRSRFQTYGGGAPAAVSEAL